MKKHDCKKPFLCSCEVDKLAEKTSDAMMKIVKEQFEQYSEVGKMKVNNIYAKDVKCYDKESCDIIYEGVIYANNIILTDNPTVKKGDLNLGNNILYCHNVIFNNKGWKDDVST